MQIPVVTDVYRWVVDVVLVDLPLIGWVEAGVEATLGALHDLGAPWALAILLVTVAARMLLLPVGLRAKRASFLLLSLRPHMKELSARYPDRKEREEHLYRLYTDNKVDILSPVLIMVLQVPLFTALARVLLGESFAGGAASTGMGMGIVPDIRLAIGDAGWGGWLLLGLYIPLQLLVAAQTAVALSRRQRQLMVAVSLVFLPFAVNMPVSLLLSAMGTIAVMVLEHKLMQRRMRGHQLVLPRDGDDAPIETVPLEWRKREHQPAAAEAA